MNIIKNQLLVMLLVVNFFSSNQLFADQIEHEKTDNSEQNFFENVGRNYIEESSNKKNTKIQIQAVQIADTPSGGNSKDLPSECDPHRIDDYVSESNLSNIQYVEYLKKYFKKCSFHLTENSDLGYWGLYKFSQNKYQFFNHPQIKQFNFKLADGTNLPAILALKPGELKRPFVVIKCGVFCSANQGPSNKNFLMSFFDQSPFNVLIISNKTGIDYIANNNNLNLGGWTEGLEAIEIGKWVKQSSPFRHLVSSLHFAGISLGGNAAVFSTYYNDLERELTGQQIFNSTMAICPVISLRDSLDKLFNHEIVGNIFYKETKDQLISGKPYLNDVSDLIREENIPRREKMRSFLGDLATISLQRRGTELNQDEFFKKNNFFNLKKSILTPLLVLASKDDMIVNYDLNSGALPGSEIFSKSKNMHLLSLNYGTHCAFSNAYGLKSVSSIIRNYILLNSPENKTLFQTQIINWNEGLPNISNSMIHTSQTWKFFKETKSVLVNFRTYNYNHSEKCQEQGPWGVEHRCNENKEKWISVDSIKVIGGRVPTNDAEAESLSREFNAKVEFVNAKGKSIIGTNAKKIYLKVKNLEKMTMQNDL